MRQRMDVVSMIEFYERSVRSHPGRKNKEAARLGHPAFEPQIPIRLDRYPTPRTKTHPWGPRFIAIFAQGRLSTRPLRVLAQDDNCSGEAIELTPYHTIHNLAVRIHQRTASGIWPKACVEQLRHGSKVRTTASTRFSAPSVNLPSFT